MWIPKIIRRLRVISLILSILIVTGCASQSPQEALFEIITPAGTKVVVEAEVVSFVNEKADTLKSNRAKAELLLDIAERRVGAYLLYDIPIETKNAEIRQYSIAVEESYNNAANAHNKIVDALVESIANLASDDINRPTAENVDIDTALVELEQTVLDGLEYDGEDPTALFDIPGWANSVIAYIVSRRNSRILEEQGQVIRDLKMNTISASDVSPFE